MNIKLRKKNLASGKKSLYLDIYKDGKREYQYLNLYIIDPKTSLDRETNKKTLALAEKVRAEKQLSYQNKNYGFKSFDHSNDDFLAYFKKLTEERFETTSNYDNWLSCYNYLVKFSNGNLLFKNVDEVFVEKFKNYLSKEKITKSNNKLSQNSALSYFNKFKACLNKAFEDKIIEFNPAKRVKGLIAEETSREYLTIEEVKKLVDTPCKSEKLKSAFLFSVLTGIRWSDINKLVWSEINESSQNGYSIIFKQKKTKGQEYLPISNEARSLLGEKDLPSERVFKGLKYSAYMNIELSKWVMKAGISKNITFHCARHTHATLLISNGTDLYTVSKLLGHKNIKTTQVYAKIIDAKKIEAVNSIPKIF